MHQYLPEEKTNANLSDREMGNFAALDFNDTSSFELRSNEDNEPNVISDAKSTTTPNDGVKPGVTSMNKSSNWKRVRIYTLIETGEVGNESFTCKISFGFFNEIFRSSFTAKLPYTPIFGSQSAPFEITEKRGLASFTLSQRPVAVNAIMNFNYDGRSYSFRGSFLFGVSKGLLLVTCRYDGSIFDSVVKDYALVNQTLLFTGGCPRIRISYATDSFFGNEVAQVIMNNGKCHSRYLPNFQRYIIDLNNSPCPNWSLKVLAISAKYYQPYDTDKTANLIAEYGILRYFLWYILTGIWSLRILKRSNDALFFAVLESNKEYRCWTSYFTKEESMKIAQYFIK